MGGQCEDTCQSSAASKLSVHTVSAFLLLFAKVGVGVAHVFLVLAHAFLERGLLLGFGRLV